jgi:hypothetical protein
MPAGYWILVPKSGILKRAPVNSFLTAISGTISDIPVMFSEGLKGYGRAERG